MLGTLVLLVGPSGSGKGTLFSFVKERYPQLVYPTSWTTRAPRQQESGKAYHFVSSEEFLKAKESGFFLETDHHFNNYYGTPLSEVKEALAAGRIIFHELEIHGVQKILEQLPREQIKIIFISAGQWEELAARITEREAISEDELEKRRVQYEEEMQFKDRADFVIENQHGKLDQAKEALSNILDSVLK